MDKQEAMKKSPSKINLKNIYTQKEIEDIEKIIPSLKPLISENIKNLTKNQKPKKFLKNISKDIEPSQYIDKNKFIELILEKAKIIFNEENNALLTKSISYILDEIHKFSKESKPSRNLAQDKLTKNYVTYNLGEKLKIKDKKSFLQRKSPEQNTIFMKLNSGKGKFSPHIKQRNKNNGLIPFSPMDKKYIPINNTISETQFKKFEDLTCKNEFKIKNIKGNSIINNFITFSNPNQNMSNSSNINLNNSNLLNDLSSFNNCIKKKKNKIYYFHDNNICNNNFRLNTINKSKTKSQKTLSPKNFLKNIELKNKQTRQISPNNIFSKCNDSKKKLFHTRNRLTEYDLSFNMNSNNNNYLTNFMKKIEKYKTEKNNVKKSNSKNNSKNSQKILCNKLKMNQNHPITYKTSFFQSKKVLNTKEIVKQPTNLIIYSNIENKDFDIFELEKNVGHENVLFIIGNYLFNKLSFSSIIKLEKFNNWCKKIASGYNRKNPYHNDLHAADVTQTSYIHLTYGKIQEKTNFNKISLCSIILSSICHDFKHPGVNNNFLMETKNKLAFRYNDLSILENMHIAQTFKLINEFQECNIFSGLDSNTYKEIRKQMISCVLSTDMANHSKHLELMKSSINKIKDNKENEAFNDTLQYMELVVHSADISNPTKKFNIYLKWAKLVVQEFLLQGDKEKSLGLPVSFDRKKIKLNKNQISFIDYVIDPYYSQYVTIFPNLKFLHDNVINNREKFVNYSEDNKAKKIIKKNNDNKISKMKE